MAESILEAVVSSVLEQLNSVSTQKIQQQVMLVGDVKKEVIQLKTNLEAIQAVLRDAEQRQVKEIAVRQWLDQIKDASYNMEDVLDEWNTEMMKLLMKDGHESARVLKKVCCYFPFPCSGIKQVVLRRDIALKMKQLNENLEAVAQQKDRYQFNVQAIERPKQVQTISLVDASEICGRVDESNILVSKLLSESSKEQNGLHIISIIGVGGIGKTTLAKLAYNNNEVKKHFQERIWVCLTDPFDELRIARAIATALNCRASDLVEFEALTRCICESIIRKKILLVLDDVWTEDYKRWEPLKRCLMNSLRGSKILITTRKRSVANMMESNDLMNIMELPKNDSWAFLRGLAFFDRSNDECQILEKIGKKIVDKCKGLPLAIKIIGSLLRWKKTREEWQLIVDSEMRELEGFQKDLLPPLLLSYNDLPSVIRCCLLSCAVFPKNYIINIDQMIKLWMAQGYLGLEQNMKMEIICQRYFEHLATQSFFQEFIKDDDDNIISCKMHDIVHDFAQFLSKNECFTREVTRDEEPTINPPDEIVVHLMLTVNKDASFPSSICGMKRLRSLLINGSSYSMPNDVLPNLFGELTGLRALLLDGDMELIEKVPNEISKLIHLRYLSLSKQKIKNLPETLCELYNLQTVDLTSCYALEELPQQIGKLINLRHLINYMTDELSYMPMQIKRLTCLQTLRKFIVSSGDHHDGKACCIDCLKDLNQLRGELEIRGLGNVTDMSKVKRAEVLKNKKNIIGLELSFDKDGRGERKSEDDELLLEALHTPPDLQKLTISCFRGNNFPSNWMMSLSNLKKLELYCCQQCKHLSPLGKLPSLESLKILQTNMKRMNNEFWGIGNDDTISSVIFFPKLKHLELRHMYELEEWDLRIREEEDIRIMPCLASLLIYRCHRFINALPDSILRRKTLKKLEILECPFLVERYRKETGEDWPNISHIPCIILNYRYVQGDSGFIPE